MKAVYLWLSLAVIVGVGSYWIGVNAKPNPVTGLHIVSTVQAPLWTESKESYGGRDYLKMTVIDPFLGPQNHLIDLQNDESGSFTSSRIK